MIKDKRIGRKGDTIQYPETTIKGRDYERPPTMIGLDYGYFAIMDTFGNDTSEIEELKAIVKKHEEANKNVRTKNKKL